MAKFYGVIGYGTTIDAGHGVWEDDIEEKECYGDIINYRRRYENPGQINDNVTISSSFSIVATPYAIDHLHNMRYIEWMGTKWKIQDITPEYPRLIINVGGVWSEG